MVESLKSQVDRLGRFLAEEVPGELGTEGSVVDAAIQLLKAAYVDGKRGPITLEQIKSQLTGIVDESRSRLSKEIATLVPRTSARATDVVAILAAVQGTPKVVLVDSPPDPPQSSSSGYSTYVPQKGWRVDVRYDDLTREQEIGRRALALQPIDQMETTPDSPHFSYAEGWNECLVRVVGGDG